MGEVDPKVLARFISKVNVAGPCWLWMAGKNPKGYGQFAVDHATNVSAHRFAWIAFRGPVPAGLCVLHNCPGGDNPSCVNPSHLWLGTRGDNNTDRDAKGRSCRGDRHWSRVNPERVPRGDAHRARLRPETCARGASHGSRTHPERLARGDRNGARLHPETLLRGERVNTAKLNDVAVRVIRLLASRGVPRWKLAATHGVGESTVNKIVSYKSWRPLAANGGAKS